jgi:hypothetical protein
LEDVVAIPGIFLGRKFTIFLKEKKVPSRVFFFFGEISPNFDLKNMILSYTNEFPWKKMAQIRQISKKKIPNHQISMISSGR